MEREYNPNIHAISFVVFKDMIEITNPCVIPFEMLEGLFKEHKKKSKNMKKGQAYSYGFIAIKIPIKQIKKRTKRGRKR